MSISSKATGLRPGVCTSTTRPTAPYTGQIIYETDTGYLRVWDGAAWDYLSQKQDYTAGLTTGKILQVVNGTSTTQVATASTTYADAGLSVSITPNSSSNKVLVLATLHWYETFTQKLHFNIVRNSTQILDTVAHGGDANNLGGTATFSVFDSPATTSSTTYKIQFRQSFAGGAGYMIASAATINTLYAVEVAV